ncbi:unnamed protein product [Gordionus sp. m RMFG-2023]
MPYNTNFQKPPNMMQFDSNSNNMPSQMPTNFLNGDSHNQLNYNQMPNYQTNYQKPPFFQQFSTINNMPTQMPNNFLNGDSNIQSNYNQISSQQQYMPPPHPQMMSYQPHYPNPNLMGGLSQPSVAPSPIKKLDPDSLPNPIQVIDEDIKNKTGLYRCEDNKESLPPAVTTDYVADNNVNCSPRFIRSTLYCAPCTQDMIKSTSIPMALTITPFAEMHQSESPLPIIDFGAMGPVRCNRCKAYMSSFMQFNDGGRKFYCPFCKTNTEVPPEYYNHLDYNGKRVDLSIRPELYCGSFEMIATKEYCKNNEFPSPPAIIFLIDVSYNAINSGMVALLCQNMKNLLFTIKNNGEELGNKLRIGIITYDKMIHFYLARNCQQPRIMIEPDLNDVFIPSHNEFLLTLDQMIESIECISDQILANFSETKLTEIMLGPAIQTGVEALKQAKCCGKLIIFHTSLPILEAPGKLENKDDPKLLGTEKEKNILLPSSTFYTKLGETCIQTGCGVDLFIFPNSYINLASLGEICRVTGGHVYKYDNFRAETDGERLISHLHQLFKRPISFDSIMKVRTSTGIRPVEYYGNFYMENSTDVEIAILDPENSITVELKHDDKLSEQENMYIQVAILYTTMGGERRLRIHNLSMKCSNLFTDIYRMCDLDTLINLLAKQAVRGIFMASAKQVKETSSKLCAQSLACYRKQCANNSSSGQLILPECMKLLPLYISCLLKTDAMLGGISIKTDDRNWILYIVRNMSVLESNGYVYPRLIPLHNIDMKDENAPTIPHMIRCSASKLEQHGVYILNNGLSMYLWIGSLANQEFLQEVFGVTMISQIDINKGLPQLNTALSLRINFIATTLQQRSYIHPKLVLIREMDPQANWVKRLLLEDQSTISADIPSYVDFLCFIYKEIRNMLDS